MQLQRLLHLNVFDLPSYTTSSLKFVSSATLQDWQSRIKHFTKCNEIDGIIVENQIAFEIDDFNLTQGDRILHPALDLVESIPYLEDQQAQVGDSPSGTTLTELISENLPLNQKQKLIVERVLSRALT